MKKYLITAVMFGLPWSGFMLITRWIAGDTVTPGILLFYLVFGLLAGALFSFLMRLFSKNILTKLVIDLEPGENLVLEAGATMYKGREGVGGKFAVTNQRVVFKSHRMNIQRGTESYNLSSIDQITTEKYLGLHNRLRLHFHSGDTALWVVDEPEHLRTVILQARQATLV